MGLILSCEACEDPKPVSAQAAASTPRDLLLQKLFSIVDQNKSGTLDVGELSQVMDNAEEFVRVCDTDNDTQITQKEFLDWSSTHIVRHLTGACGSKRRLLPARLVRKLSVLADQCSFMQMRTWTG